MQWDRLSLYKEITQVTGVSAKHLPILKSLKNKPTPEDINNVIAVVREEARAGKRRAQCVMGFLCCIGYAEKTGKKNLYGIAIGRLDEPCGPGGVVMYAIGDDYYPVTGHHQDLEEAAYWYRRSAAHEYPPAQMLYGDCLFSGEGVEPDLPEAVSFYQKASDQGNAMACRRLGDCAFLGIGLAQNTDEAVAFFERAARLGCRDALWRLGDLYYQGVGVERNTTMAEVFYEEAAEAGVASAMCMIGDRYFYGKNEKERINYEAAAKWYKKSARKEDEWGLFALGTCYFHGKGVNQSYKKAVKLFRRSARYGCPDALWRLASCYYNGIGIKKNKKKAYRCYREAARMYAIYNES